MKKAPARFALLAAAASAAAWATVPSVPNNAKPLPAAIAGLQVDLSKIPPRGVGAAVDDLAYNGRLPAPSGDGTGDFRTVCMFSHMAFDDPIVLPGQPGQSHLHTFAGNMLTNAVSTVESLSTTGNSTCRGGTVNRSAYWQPAVIDTLDGTPIKPDSVIVYYKSGYNQVAPADIHELPIGLRMIAGNPAGRTEARWGPAHFTCAGPNGEGHGYVFPSDCAAGSVIWAKVDFPQCWDGHNLDSPDHRSHMAYGGIGKDVKPGCPSTHPVALPAITINFLYTVKDAAAIKRWRFASDMYDPAQPAGYSLHADWFNGWKPEIVERWTRQCINPGKDCGADMLGDGWSMNEGKP